MKTVPFEFVLEELGPLHPATKPMFGCHAIYIGEKIVLILRERSDEPDDNGIWVATTAEHHLSLRRDLPSLRSIGIFGPGPTGWQNLPSSADDFEECALRACELIRQGDPRIGKIPKRKRLSAKKAKTASGRGKTTKKSGVRQRR